MLSGEGGSEVVLTLGALWGRTARGCAARERRGDAWCAATPHGSQRPGATRGAFCVAQPLPGTAAASPGHHETEGQQSEAHRDLWACPPPPRPKQPYPSADSVLATHPRSRGVWALSSTWLPLPY